MILDKVFNIVSHFKFEVGAGLVSLAKVEDKLGAVSKASQNVSNQFKFLFARSALSLTGATGGIIGVIHKSIDASEKFYKVQEKLGQVIAGNSKNFKQPVKDFNEAMNISKGILTGMVSEANKLGVGFDDYTSTFNHFNTLLVPKGVAGDNLDKSKKLALAMMRGSGVLGMHQGNAIYQAGSLIEGQANPNQTLFRRLKTETQAFKGVSASQFNAKKPKERIDMMIKGIGQFTDSTQLLERHLKSLTGQMTILRNLFSSAGSIMRPFGDIFKKILVEGLTVLNKILENKTSKIIKVLAKDFNSLNFNLESLYTTVSKVNTLGADFSSAKYFAGLLFIFIELKTHLPKLVKMLLSVLKLSVALPVGFAARILSLTSVLKAFGFVIGLVFKSIVAYLKIGIPIFALLRVFQAARIKAKLLDAKYVTTNMDRYSEKLVVLRRMYSKMINPISYLIDYLSKFFLIIFSRSKLLITVFAGLKKIGILKEGILETKKVAEESTSSLTMFARIMLRTIALFETMFTVMGNIIVKTFSYVVKFLKFMSNEIKQIFSYSFKGISNLFGSKKKGTEGAEGIEGFTSKIKEKFKGFAELIFGKDSAIGKILLKPYNENLLAQEKDYKKQYDTVNESEKARNVINIAKLEINNKFRENLEPDRIAVAIKDVLTQAVQAPTGTESRDNTYIGGVGGGFVGG